MVSRAAKVELMQQTLTLERKTDYWTGRFRAMAGPCEVLMDVDERAVASDLLEIAFAEAQRIENKFSRYRDDNIVYRINNAQGKPLEVDEETAGLIDYAAQCFSLSDGLFDITSGVLREVWRFGGPDNGTDHIPDEASISRILPRIGWQKTHWQRPVFSLPARMQIDFGGIGKEYAVDRSALLLNRHSAASLLINYGGDIYVTCPRRNGGGWFVGLEDPDHADSADMPNAASATNLVRQFELLQGGVATSGDARRYFLKDGKRYGHILDPRTGWPVEGAPRSVTTVASTCTEAGILASLAMLQGRNAESFLAAQGGRYWCLR